MRYKVFVFSLPLLISASFAETVDYAQAQAKQNLYQNLILAETETHSTAGISNNKVLRENRGYTQSQTEEVGSYDDELVNEQLPPPTSTKNVSPTKSKTITRTTSRPTQQNAQPNGVGVAPVVVPVYPDGRFYQPPPPDFYQPPPSLHR